MINYHAVAEQLGMTVDVGGTDNAPIFNWSGATPTRAEINLVSAKINKCIEMIASFNAAINEDVVYNGVVYQSGDSTRKDLDYAITSFVSAGNPLPAGFEWRTKDNSMESFSIANIKGLSGLVSLQYTDAKTNLSAKKDEIILANTVAAVNAVAW